MSSHFPLSGLGFLTVTCGRDVESLENWAAAEIVKPIFLLRALFLETFLRIRLALSDRMDRIWAPMSTFPQALLLLLEFILFYS